jgi:hypothetical protein
MLHSSRSTPSGQFHTLCLSSFICQLPLEVVKSMLETLSSVRDSLSQHDCMDNATAAQPSCLPDDHLRAEAARESRECESMSFTFCLGTIVVNVGSAPTCAWPAGRPRSVAKLILSGFEAMKQSSRAAGSKHRITVADALLFDACYELRAHHTILQGWSAASENGEHIVIVEVVTPAGIADLLATHCHASPLCCFPCLILPATIYPRCLAGLGSTGTAHCRESSNRSFMLSACLRDEVCCDASHVE